MTLPMTFRRTFTSSVCTAATTLLSSLACQAHITLDQPQATAGSTYKAALRVGHGCNGSPTHTVAVRLPAGFRGAKPIPKAGWTLTIRKEPLAQPYDNHGVRITEEVVEVRWQANTPADALQEAWYDEFVVRGQLPERPGPLWFKVQQVCETGSWDWSEVPAAGTGNAVSTQGLKGPAALLQVLPADPHAGHQGH